MKQGSTLFLKSVVVVLGLAVLALTVAIWPAVIDGPTDGYSPILIWMYLTAIPFFIALMQTWKLLGYIDQQTAFSDRSVQALATIKNAALTIAAMYAASLPYVYWVAEQDDAPGVILIGLLLTGAPIVIATFAAVLQKLLGAAIALKSENDLTV